MPNDLAARTLKRVGLLSALAMVLLVASGASPIVQSGARYHPASSSSSSSSGGLAVTPQSGWTIDSGAAASGSSLVIGRAAADMGTGPTVVLYANFRGNTPGATVSTTATVGSFAAMRESDEASNDVPRYQTGPDGGTWMNTLTPAMVALCHWTQATISTAAFDTWYISHRHSYDGGEAIGDSNQKDIWVMRGDIDGNGTGHDTYVSAYSAIAGGNSQAGITIFTDDSGGDNPGSLPSVTGKAWPRLTDNFRSYGIKPHTSAAFNANTDAFLQSVDPKNGRYQTTSTNHESIFGLNSSPFNYTYIDIPGMYQDTAACGHDNGTGAHATYYYWNDILFQTGANAWKRFFWANNATLASATLMYDAYSTSWSASSVTIVNPTISSYAALHLFYGNGTTYTRVGTTP